MALINISNFMVNYWYLLPGIPLAIWLFIKLIRKFQAGRMGWDMFTAEDAHLRPLGREEHRRPHHAAPWAPWWPAACRSSKPCTSPRRPPATPSSRTSTRRSTTPIREGESIAKPMKENSRTAFHPMALFFWIFLTAGRSAC